jgi:formylglycine-generating enzyme required for sulfatase activity
MLGNAFEWCADAQRTYTAQAGRDPDGATEGDVRVLRGGGDPAYRAGNFGFRVALPVSAL